MGCARYVGRVGALAVALGVGAAVATIPGVAWAEETGEDNASVDGAPANPEPATAPEDEGNDGGGDPGDPNRSTSTTTTTTTTGTQSTTVIGGGGSPQVTISGSTVDLSGTTTEQTPESSAPTTAEVTPTATVEPTTPPQPTYTPEPTPSPVPAPISSTVPDPPATVGGGDEQELNAGEGDPQDLLDGQGDPSGTMKITAFDSGADPVAGQYNLRMTGPTGVDDPQNFMAADYTAGVTTLDAPAPPPPPDPLEALSVLIGSLISQAMNAVSAALAPIFGPGAPLYNSMIWGAIEAVRRQTNQAWANSTPMVDLQTTGQQDPDDREIHGTLGGSDSDGDALTYSVPTSGVGAPAHGTVTVDAAAGKWTYRPNTGYVGADSFTITASDAAAGVHIHGVGQSHTGSDSITVTVVDPNRVPVADADSYSVGKNKVLTVPVATGVLDGDTDADGDSLTAVRGEGPANGTLSLNDNGSFTYTPNTGFVGTDSFTYKAKDNSGALSDAVTVSISVDNTVPVADADSYSVGKNKVLTVPVATGVLDGDTDADGDSLTAVRGEGPANGTLSLNDNGSFTYTPNTGFVGTDSFTYKAKDNSGALSDAVTVSISVDNTVPVADADSYSVGKNKVLTVPVATGVLDGDTDADGDSLTAVRGEGPANGTLSLNDNGSFTYTPNTGFAGTDSFTYKAKDQSGALSDAVSVTITVVNTRPVMGPDGTMVNVNKNGSITVAAPGLLANDSDPDGDPLTAVLTEPATYGTVQLNPDGSFTYTAAPGYVGADSFKYQAMDNSGALSDFYAVGITVFNTRPVANNDSYSVNEDETLTVNEPGVLSNDTDVNGDPLTALLVSPTTNGTLTLNANGSFAYKPNPNYNGGDSFTYRAVDDSDQTSAIRTVTITVNAINDAPVAQGDSFSTNEDTPLTTGNVLTNDTDPDGDIKHAVLVSGPANAAPGSFALNDNGTFTYTPEADFNGSDSFTYKVNDGVLDSNTVTVSIAVAAVGEAPVVTTTSGETIADGGFVAIDSGLTVSDADSANLKQATITVDGWQAGDLYTYHPLPAGYGTIFSPSTGTLIIQGQSWTVSTWQEVLRQVKFRPATDSVVAERTFTIVVTDGAFTSAPVTKTVVRTQSV